MLGGNIRVARIKRRLTMAMMAERANIVLSTYQRVEQGDPSVAFGTYATVLFALGAGDHLSILLDVSTDDTGLLLDVARLPKRVRASKRSNAS